MQCEEFEDRLNAVLDQRNRPETDAKLRLHCETCSDCRQLAVAYDWLLDGFSVLTVPKAPDDMAARVLADLQPQLAPSRRWTVAAAAMTIAAGLLIAVMPLLRSTQAPPTNSAAHATVASSEKAIAAVAAPMATGLPVGVVRESLDLNKLPIVSEFLAFRNTDEDPYAGLAKETGQGLATVIRYVPGIGGSMGIVDLSGTDEPAWAVQMSEGLKPITDSVAETVNLLLRTLPAVVADSRS